MPTRTIKNTPAEQSRQELRERIEARDESKAILRALKSDLASFERGDSDLSESDYLALRGRIDYAAIRLDQAQRSVRAAEAQLASDDKSLAEALSATLGAILRVPVLATTGDVDDVPTPSLAIVQRQASKRHAEGFLSGAVQLHYRRSGLLARLDARTLCEALDDAGFRVGGPQYVATSQTDDGNFEDRTDLSVRLAFPEVPEVAEDAQPDLARLGGNLAAVLGHASPKVLGSIRRRNYFERDARVPLVSWFALPSAARVVQEQTDAEGVRHLALEVAIGGKLNPEAREVDVANLGGLIRQGSAVIPSLEGIAQPFLGRVSSVELVRTGDAGKPYPLSVAFVLRVTFVSKVAA